MSNVIDKLNLYTVSCLKLQGALSTNILVSAWFFVTPTHRWWYHMHGPSTCIPFLQSVAPTMSICLVFSFLHTSGGSAVFYGNGLPPTPNTLHLGCSYHLHSSHHFLSTQEKFLSTNHIAENTICSATYLSSGICFSALLIQTGR